MRSATSLTAVRVSRHFEASPERLFDSWLDPDVAKSFLFATPTGRITRCDIDARVGGKFTIMDRRDDENVEHTGEYLEIDRPRRLVFTFAVPQCSPAFTRVTITISPKVIGCELRLNHEGVLAEYEERTREGWSRILGALASVLEDKRVEGKRSPIASGRNGSGQSKLQLTQAPIAKTGMLIRRPAADVFEAFIDPDITTQFWFTKSSGRLELGKEIKWDWEMYHASTQVKVKVIEPNKRIVIEWDGYSGRTNVEWKFATQANGTTFVSITESGWTGDGDELVRFATDSTAGFTWTLAGLKALLEHNVRLNLVADRFPKGPSDPYPDE